MLSLVWALIIPLMLIAAFAVIWFMIQCLAGSMAEMRVGSNDEGLVIER